MSNTTPTYENYLELMVPIRGKAHWFDCLRNAFEKNHIQVSWQERSFHITAVFVNDGQHVEALRAAFIHVLKGRKALPLPLGKLEVFTTRSGNQLIVHMSPSEEPKELMALINELREAAAGTGANFQQDFRLHITLGRINIPAPNTNEERVREILNDISVPQFSLLIDSIIYRYRKVCPPNEKMNIKEWNLR